MKYECAQKIAKRMRFCIIECIQVWAIIKRPRAADSRPYKGYRSCRTFPIGMRGQRLLRVIYSLMIDLNSRQWRNSRADCGFGCWL